MADPMSHSVDRMKTIGLLGGMSWESSIEYERIINRETRRRLGGTASADLLIRSYNFAEIERLQAEDRWDDAGQLLADDARRLQQCGADLIVLCTNTMHRVADTIQAGIGVPLLHLGDATARAVVADKVSTVGLLGTRYTMEHDFYRSRLESHGLDVRVPDAADRTIVHDVIYRELVRGEIRSQSKGAYLKIIDKLGADGAQGIIAGCTEIELLVGPDDLALPLYPTARLHALAAVDAALADG